MPGSNCSAYQQGRDAANTGAAYSHNPFPQGHAYHGNWSDGFRAAMRHPREPHPMEQTFTHWTRGELYAAQALCHQHEGHDCFLMINLNKKMTYLQMARNAETAKVNEYSHG